MHVEHTLDQLSHFPSLTSLDISNCDLTDQSTQPIKSLENLVFLDISHNKELTGEVLANICAIKRLKELLMQNCPRIVSGLKYLKELPSLTSISLSHCGVSDEDIRWLEPFTWLETLTLIRANITDKGIDSIGKLTSLTALDLSMCANISDVGVRVLRKLPHIKNLNLNFCSNLTDAGVAALTGLTTLGIFGCNRLLIQGNNNNMLTVCGNKRSKKNNSWAKKDILTNRCVKGRLVLVYISFSKGINCPRL